MEGGRWGGGVYDREGAQGESEKAGKVLFPDLGNGYTGFT